MITGYIMLSLLAYQELQKGRLVTKPNANHVHYKDAYECVSRRYALIYVCGVEK